MGKLLYYHCFIFRFYYLQLLYNSTPQPEVLHDFVFVVVQIQSSNELVALFLRIVGFFVFFFLLYGMP